MLAFPDMEEKYIYCVSKSGYEKSVIRPAAEEGAVLLELDDLFEWRICMALLLQIRKFKEEGITVHMNRGPFLSFLVTLQQQNDFLQFTKFVHVFSE